MTTDRDVLPAGAEALPDHVSTKTAPGRQGKRPNSPGNVRNRPETSGIARKRPDSPGIAMNGPEMPQNVKVRRGGKRHSGEKSRASNELPVSSALGVSSARTRRKYGDWQMAAELFALGRTPAEVADVLGVPVSKVSRNLRESRRLRRWIAEHYARIDPARAERPPDCYPLNPLRARKRIGFGSLSPSVRPRSGCAPSGATGFSTGRGKGSQLRRRVAASSAD